MRENAIGEQINGMRLLENFVTLPFMNGNWETVCYQ
jgi:hypothetical protein